MFSTYPKILMLKTTKMPLLLLLACIVTFQTASGQNGLDRCQPIQVPMCKGLVDYNTTRLPNIFGHHSQTEVYWALQPWWPFIDAGCSDNLRTFLCGLYLPRCVGDGHEVHYPCSQTCQKAKVRCSKHMRREGTRWAPRFQCSRLLPTASGRCIAPHRERKKNRNRKYTLCHSNELSMCQDIPFTRGSLPNMFLQNNVAEIDREMQQFRFLVASGCSRKLRLFMCGVYMPFCVPKADEGSIEIVGTVEDNLSDEKEQQPNNAMPFIVPCRELCQEVYDQCSGEYQQRTNGLPWPAKFHCHRYPSYVDRYDSNSSNITSGRADRSSRVPCTMPPYNYEGN